jgi:GTP-sensing pleiotropic transcriptional regulator CodY
MKHILFSTAVLLAAGELRAQGSFSIHQVTTKIREWVNSGDVVFSDRSPLIGGSFAYDVNHQEVKEIFTELCDEKILSNLDCQFNGTYNIFTCKNLVKQVTQAPTQKTAVWNRQVTSAKIAPVDLLSFLKARRGQAITMKQIQSRFKDTPRTCADYANIVLSLGFVIGNANLPVSKQTVRP